MKRTVLLSCLLGLVAWYEQRAAPQQATARLAALPASRVAIPKAAIRGEFDGDGTPEYVWLVPLKLDSTSEECVGRCISYVTSTNAALRPYALQQFIAGS